MQGDAPVLELEGPPHVRGRRHGAAVRDQVRLSLDRWGRDVTAVTGLDTDTYLQRFLAATNFFPSFDVAVPGLLDEVRGIADGAGITFEEAAALQLIDEIWIHLAITSGRRPDYHEHCSALGGVGPDGMVVAQNFDFPAWYDGLQVLLRMAPTATGPGATVLTMAGCVGIGGANDASVAVAVNALPQLAAGRDGVPVAVVVRGILERATCGDATAFVRAHPHASGQHYLIADPTELVGLEAGADAVVDVPAPATGYAHTNHPLVAPPTEGGTASVSETALSFSGTRLDFVDLGVAAGPLDVDRALAILGDRTTPICRQTDDGLGNVSAWTVVYALGPPLRVLAAPGPGTKPIELGAAIRK